MFIKRLISIENIIELKQQYMNKYAVEITNVSDWKVSNAFKQKMCNTFENADVLNPVDYLYSYSIDNDIKKKIIEKLGLHNDLTNKKTGIVFPNNTSAIVNLCNFLQKKKLKNICIVEPSYFSISNCLKAFNMNCDTKNIKRTNGKFIFPYDEIINNKYDAIWITSPIYSTGVCFDKDIIGQIHLLLKMGILILADESFSINSYELLKEFGKYDNFIGIYSPHKSLSLNSFKFSIVVIDQNAEDFLDQWLDVLTGNLPQTSIAATHHFLSQNFELCKLEFNQYIIQAHNDVTSLLKQYKQIEYDHCTQGNFITIYVKNITFEQINTTKFLENIINETHTLFYPGFLNGYGEEWGACFRINLALYDKSFVYALHRLLDYLENYHT